MLQHLPSAYLKFFVKRCIRRTDRNKSDSNCKSKTIATAMGSASHLRRARAARRRWGTRLIFRLEKTFPKRS